MRLHQDDASRSSRIGVLGSPIDAMHHNGTKAMREELISPPYSLRRWWTMPSLGMHGGELLPASIPARCCRSNKRQWAASWIGHRLNDKSRFIIYDFAFKKQLHQIHRHCDALHRRCSCIDRHRDALPVRCSSMIFDAGGALHSGIPLFKS